MADSARDDTQRPLAVNVVTGLMAAQLVVALVTLMCAIWTPELLALSTSISDVLGDHQLIVIPLLAMGFATLVIVWLWRGYSWAWSAALGICLTLLYGRTLLLGTGAVLVGEGIVFAGAVGDVCLLVFLVFPSVRRWVGRSR